MARSRKPRALVTGGASEIVYEPLPENGPKRDCPDMAYATEVLDREPRVPAREGLKRTLECGPRADQTPLRGLSGKGGR